MLHIAVNAEESSMSSEATKAFNTVGLMRKPATQIPTLNEEGKYFNWEGQIETGFSNFVVPTLEEIVTEQRPAREQGDSNKLSPVQDEIPGDRGAKTLRTNDNTPFGAPADAGKPDVDNTPPRPTSLNKEGQEVPESKIRNTAKLGVRRPEVGQDNFEDPICDTFWQNIWVASAVYNVITFKPTPGISLAEFTLCRPKFSVTFSMPFQMILSPLGRSTRNILFSMNA